MNLTELIGFMAATLTTLSFIPQAWKVFKTQETRDLSLGMFALFTLGVFLWGVYGTLLASLPIIVANTITFLLSLYIMLMKLKYG